MINSAEEACFECSAGLPAITSVQFSLAWLGWHFGRTVVLATPKAWRSAKNDTLCAGQSNSAEGAPPGQGVLAIGEQKA